MKAFFKSVSAAMLSLLLAGSAYAGPSFGGVTLTVHDMTLQGASTSMVVDKDGNYTITTDGGMAHFIAIRGKGKLTAEQMSSIETYLEKADKANPPANLPGIVPGAAGFTISWDGNHSVSGSTNVAGAIEDAKQNHQDVSGWTAMKPLFTKLSSLETALEKAAPTLTAPDDATKKAALPFDELKIHESSLIGPGGVPPTSTLTIKSDGSYTLDHTGNPALGQKDTSITGQLTPDQIASLAKAYKANTLAADNGKSVGGLIPGDSEFTITASEGGKTYTVQGPVDSKKLGPLQALEKVLVGDVSGLHPAVAQPLDKDSSIPESSTKFFDDVSASRTAISARDGVARTAGLSGVLKARVDGESSKADGKEVGEDGK
jgi:hypothetical protein